MKDSTFQEGASEILKPSLVPKDGTEDANKTNRQAFFDILDASHGFSATKSVDGSIQKDIIEQLKRLQSFKDQ